ncbi:MAG TPA: PilZ domain-containing protein, partial [Blastocatellia bacterium]|nr:PilZ domain-containing protein [Blastocatellia bacterium]
MSFLHRTAQSAPGGTPPGAAKTQAYFIEVDELLAAIERADTPYHVLSLDRSASRERVLEAYQQVLNLLFPPYHLSVSFPAEFRHRLDQAFEKTAQALSVLADFNRRKEYDQRPQPITKPSPPAEKPTSRLRHLSDETIEIGQTVAQREVFTISKDDGKNRRRSERFKMKLPVRVTGHDRQEGRWHEMTESVDVSRTGVLIRVSHRVLHNTVLQLTLPLPLKLRAHGFTEATYNVYGIVRRVVPLNEGVRAVGVEFIGEHPPPGYLDKPWAVCRTKQWLGINRR